MYIKVVKWLKKILKHTLEEQENRLLIISSPLVFMHLACIGIFFTGFKLGGCMGIINHLFHSSFCTYGRVSSLFFTSFF